MVVYWAVGGDNSGVWNPLHLYTYKRLSRWQPYNTSVPLDLKVTKDTRLILNIKYTSEN